MSEQQQAPACPAEYEWMAPEVQAIWGGPVITLKSVPYFSDEMGVWQVDAVDWNGRKRIISCSFIDGPYVDIDQLRESLAQAQQERDTAMSAIFDMLLHFDAAETGEDIDDGYLLSIVDSFRSGEADSYKSEREKAQQELEQAREEIKRLSAGIPAILAAQERSEQDFEQIRADNERLTCERKEARARFGELEGELEQEKKRFTVAAKAADLLSLQVVEVGEETFDQKKKIATLEAENQRLTTEREKVRALLEGLRPVVDRIEQWLADDDLSRDERDNLIAEEAVILVPGLRELREIVGVREDG